MTARLPRRAEEGRAYLARSSDGDGGPSDSTCPSEAFSVGATYFPFTGSSSSSRLGCRERHNRVTPPQLPRGRMGGLCPAARSSSPPHRAPSALPLAKETDARTRLGPELPAQVRRPTRKRSPGRAASAAHGEGPASYAGGRGLAGQGERGSGRTDGRAERPARGAARRGAAGTARLRGARGAAPSRRARALGVGVPTTKCAQLT
jgi:hypothetical protein